MRRFWLGIGLLTVLLALGIVTQAAMTRLHIPMAQQLEQAAQAALEGDWEQAAQLSGQAAKDWERSRPLTAAVADHSPMDEVEMLLAEMKIYAAERDKTYFAAACARAARLIRATGEAHSLNLQNFL